MQVYMITNGLDISALIMEGGITQSEFTRKSTQVVTLAGYLEEQCKKHPMSHVEMTEAPGRLYLRTRQVQEDETAFAVIAAGVRLIERAFPESVSFTPWSGDAM